jgi:AAA domain
VCDDADEVVRFEVTTLTKTVWGIRGRVTVRSRMKGARVVPNMSGYVTTETMDFLSGKSRQMFATRLAELIPAPKGSAVIDWSLVVERMVAQIMDQEHRQPVVLDLATVTATSYTPHLWPYVVPERKATIMYGAGGTGKSALACGIAAAVQTGKPLLGYKTKQANVLYLDWETDEGDVAHRLAAASRGIGLTAVAPVKYMSLELPLELEMTHIAAAVVENDIGLIILDSVGMASTQGRDGSDPAAGAIEFFRALRILNAAVLCIDHISGEDQRRGRLGASKPYGSIFKWNTARNAFELIDATEDQSGSRLILRHRKANLGPKMPGGEVMMRVKWDTTVDSVTYQRVVTNEPQVSLPERITEALETGPASYKTLLDILNSNYQYDMVDEAQVRGASRALLSGAIATIDNSGVLRLTKVEDGKESKDAPSISLALDGEDSVDS